MRRRPFITESGEAGGAATGLIVAIVLLAAVGVAAFFYFGGEADVDIKKPDVRVTSSETPN
jgi:flagellar basal body-associated protein FliL